MLAPASVMERARRRARPSSNIFPFSGPQLTKDLLFLVVLPGLLSEGAQNLTKTPAP